MSMMSTFTDPTIDDIILVINCGSSTVKYQLLAMTANKVLLKGLIEGVDQQQGQHHYDWLDNDGRQHNNLVALFDLDYEQSFNAIAELISTLNSPSPTAIGHRIVHGGEAFVEPTLIDATVLMQIEQLSILAPLHNPANVHGIRVCLALFPTVPQVAVFDTAFHQTLPDYAYRYPVPNDWYVNHHIRKYGFHGTSHHYVAQQAAVHLQKPLNSLNLISLHLGNGASVAAIEHGKCIDTSMGFTPLEGLMMGTRCGDIDPAISLYLQQENNMTAEQVEDQLNHHSGLLAIAGSHDMRDILRQCDHGDPASELAIKMYCYRIKKYIGAYLAALGHVDAIIFTGGVGENSVKIRAGCCQNLEQLGITIDKALNEHAETSVSAINSNNNEIKILIIKTNEEQQIANEVVRFIKKPIV